MIFILGVYFKEKFSVLYSINKLFGIGKYIALLILNDLNISFNSRVKSLTQSITIKILKWIDLNKILIKDSLKQKMSLGNRSKPCKNLRF